MLVLNYIVTFKDHDQWEYMEYEQLKLFLTRRQRMMLYNNLKNDINYLSAIEDGPLTQVMGV